MTLHTPMNFVEVLGAQMAYLDRGPKTPPGLTAVFVHGNPTSSYLWRNVLPHVASTIRCIAPDLIGFGYSDKPDIAYRVEDHARYLDSLLDVLNLEDVVLVGHAWGSALIMDWARRHPEKVRGLGLLEFLTPMPTWLDATAQVAETFKSYRNPDTGPQQILEQNTLLEHGLQGGVLRQLSQDELSEYRRPFDRPEHRTPLFRFTNELPIAGTPPDVYAMFMANHEWLLETPIPKIFFHADPGMLMPPARAQFYAARLKNCKRIDLGTGRHFLPEDHGDTIGLAISRWLASLG